MRWRKQVTPKQARSQAGANVCNDPQQIWMHPLGICKISKTNMLISPLKSCDTVPHRDAASVEPPWLETIHFQKCIYMQDFCAVL
jgi:hypothetical protein